MNFERLQDMIYKAVKVPPERQRIRIGFPPKELKRPSGSDLHEPIPLAHGDKISLEIIPLTHSLSESGAESPRHHEHSGKRQIHVYLLFTVQISFHWVLSTIDIILIKVCLVLNMIFFKNHTCKQKTIKEFFVGILKGI